MAQTENNMNQEELSPERKRIAEKKQKTKNRRRNLEFRCLMLVVMFLFAHLFALVTSRFMNNFEQGWSGDVSNCCFVEETPEDGSEKIFSDEEVLAFTKAVQKSAEENQLNFIIVAGRNPLDDYQTKDFTDTFYDKVFGEETDGLLYYIDMSGDYSAYDYISTSGRAVLPFEESYASRREALFAELDNYLPTSEQVRTDGLLSYKENFKEAINKFIEFYPGYYNDFFIDHPNGGQGEPYFQSPNTGRYLYYWNNKFYITTMRPFSQRRMTVFIAEIIGFIAAIIFISRIKKIYRFIEKTNASIYVQDDKTNFFVNEEKYIGTETKKQYSPRSSSSSGGGGHSGGGSHGGGGHHR